MSTAVQPPAEQEIGLYNTVIYGGQYDLVSWSIMDQGYDSALVLLRLVRVVAWSGVAWQRDIIFPGGVSSSLLLPPNCFIVIRHLHCSLQATLSIWSDLTSRVSLGPVHSVTLGLSCPTLTSRPHSDNGLWGWRVEASPLWSTTLCNIIKHTAQTLQPCQAPSG